jgi:hypothetical protein
MPFKKTSIEAFSWMSDRALAEGYSLLLELFSARFILFVFFDKAVINCSTCPKFVTMFSHIET